jgi:hypothetical protein
MSELEEKGQEKAILALITGALHPFDVDKEVTDSEALEFLKAADKLTESQKQALAKISDDPIAWLSAERLDDKKESVAFHEKARELAAMHRQAPDEGLDEETLKEIARKRQEILDKLEKRKKGS